MQFCTSWCKGTQCEIAWVVKVNINTNLYSFIRNSFKQLMKNHGDWEGFRTEEDWGPGGGQGLTSSPSFGLGGLDWTVTTLIGKYWTFSWLFITLSVRLNWKYLAEYQGFGRVFRFGQIFGFSCAKYLASAEYQKKMYAVEHHSREQK